MKENFRLDGKTAIVTGAGSGIGQAIARRFARSGAKVCLVDIRREQVEGTARQIKEDGGPVPVAVTCDVTDSEATSREFSKIAAEGRVDILVNSAGVSNIGRLDNTSEEDFDRLFRVNVKGVYLCMKAIIEPMKRAGGGIILRQDSLQLYFSGPHSHALCRCVSEAALCGARRGDVRQVIAGAADRANGYAGRGRIARAISLLGRVVLPYGCGHSAGWRLF